MNRVIYGKVGDGVFPLCSSLSGGAFRFRLVAIACVVFGTSGCISATALDARLTALGRAAAPLKDQSRAQQVDDATACREAIMDGLLHVGAYALYNPVTHRNAAGATRAQERRLAQCLERRGYAVLVPSSPTGAP